MVYSSHYRALRHVLCIFLTWRYIAFVSFFGTHALLHFIIERLRLLYANARWRATRRKEYGYCISTSLISMMFCTQNSYMRWNWEMQVYDLTVKRVVFSVIYIHWAFTNILKRKRRVVFWHKRETIIFVRSHCIKQIDCPKPNTAFLVTDQSSPCRLSLYFFLLLSTARLCYTLTPLLRSDCTEDSHHPIRVDTPSVKCYCELRIRRLSSTVRPSGPLSRYRFRCCEWSTVRSLP